MKKSLIFFIFIPIISFGQTASVDDILKSYIDDKSENPVSSILMLIESENISYNKEFSISDNSIENDFQNKQFKIASSTKLFVATIILQLAEEGKLNLNDKANKFLGDIDYLNFKNFHIFNGKKYYKKITIKQLLSHRSGLADIFSDRQAEFVQVLQENPSMQYSSKKIVELYFKFNLNSEAHFKPNKSWHYSDMNYVLLGLIIEKIEEKPLHESIRERLLEPLKMKNTFFEYYELPEKQKVIQNQFVGNINFTEINTSFDWAGGGLVSTNSDLSIFIKALFDNRLLSQKSLKKMINTKETSEGESKYGLGIYETEYNGKTFYGHYGFYGSYIGYCPENKMVISYSINQASPNFSVYKLVCKTLSAVE